MKAIRVYQAGGPEVLQIEELPRPQPRSGWVLIHVKAFGLNRSEMYTRQGFSPNVQFPRVLGSLIVYSPFTKLWRRIAIWKRTVQQENSLYQLTFSSLNKTACPRNGFVTFLEYCLEGTLCIPITK
jgi:hypothetical protein